MILRYYLSLILFFVGLFLNRVNAMELPSFSNPTNGLTSFNPGESQNASLPPSLRGSLESMEALSQASTTFLLPTRGSGPASGIIHVLSLDGAGARNYMQLLFLRALEERLKKPIHEVFQVIGGTGWGGVIATLLAKGIKVSEIISFFLDTMRETLNPSLWHRLKTRNGFRGPKYSLRALENGLSSLLKPTDSLRDLKTNLVVPIAQITQNQGMISTVFSTRLAHSNPALYNPTLTEVARATVATPGYFDAVPILEHFYAADILLGENPVKTIVNETKVIYPNAQGMMVLSLGTGVSSQGFTPHAEWGPHQWHSTLVNHCFYNQGQSTHQSFQNDWRHFFINALDSSSKEDLPRKEPVPAYQRVDVGLKQFIPWNHYSHNAMGEILEAGHSLVYAQNSGHYTQQFQDIVCSLQEGQSFIIKGEK